MFSKAGVAEICLCQSRVYELHKDRSAGSTNSSVGYFRCRKTKKSSSGSGRAANTFPGVPSHHPELLSSTNKRFSHSVSQCPLFEIAAYCATISRGDVCLHVEEFSACHEVCEAHEKRSGNRLVFSAVHAVLGITMFSGFDILGHSCFLTQMLLENTH